MATRNTNTVSSNNNRKAKVTANDIVMAYMLEGIDAVSRSLIDHTNPVKCLDDAMDKILSRNGSADVQPLKVLREKFASGKTTGRRGAVGLKPGTVKTYSVQKVGEAGDLFIRLPVSLLADRKGALVEVEALEDGTLVVRAAQA